MSVLVYAITFWAGAVSGVVIMALLTAHGQREKADAPA